MLPSCCTMVQCPGCPRKAYKFQRASGCPYGCSLETLAWFTTGSWFDGTTLWCAECTVSSAAKYCRSANNKTSHNVWKAPCARCSSLTQHKVKQDGDRWIDVDVCSLNTDHVERLPEAPLAIAWQNPFESPSESSHHVAINTPPIAGSPPPPPPQTSLPTAHELQALLRELRDMEVRQREETLASKRIAQANSDVVESLTRRLALFEDAFSKHQLWCVEKFQLCSMDIQDDGVLIQSPAVSLVGSDLSLESNHSLPSRRHG